MIKTRIISCLVFLQFVCIPAYSQKDGVVVVYAKASSGYDIQVTNTRSVPVMAFTVRCQIRTPSENIQIFKTGTLLRCYRHARC